MAAKDPCHKGLIDLFKKPSFRMGVEKTRRKCFSYDIPDVTDRSLVNKEKRREFWKIKVVGQETEMHFTLQKTMQTSIPKGKPCMWDDMIKHHVILHIHEGGCHNFTRRITNREPSSLISCRLSVCYAADFFFLSLVYIAFGLLKLWLVWCKQSCKGSFFYGKQFRLLHFCILLILLHFYVQKRYHTWNFLGRNRNTTACSFLSRIAAETIETL